MKLVSVIVFAFFYALAHSDREFNDVTVTESLSEDHSEFVNTLLDKLEEKAVLSESVSSKILGTFNVKGVNRDQGSAYTKTTIKSLKVGGDGDAGKKFVSRLASLFGEDEQGLHLIEYLLELTMDNDVLDAKEGAELAGASGYGVKVKVTRYSSTSEDYQGQAQAPASKQGCCAKDLTPLFEMRINVGRDLYYLADVPAFAYYMNTCGGCRRYINSAVARVAGSASACGCAGVKLQPVYYVYKGFVHGSEHDHHYTTDLNDAKNKPGYIPWDGKMDKPAYYCAKTKGQCGATEALKRYSYGHLHLYTTSAAVGAKQVAGGWKDEGVLCYVWPYEPIV